MVQAGGTSSYCLETCGYRRSSRAWGDRPIYNSLTSSRQGLSPRCDLDAETTARCASGMDGQGIIQSAHDCSEGGLAVTLAECCISGEEARHTPHLMGASIQLESLKVCVWMLCFLRIPGADRGFHPPQLRRQTFGQENSVSLRK